MLTRVRVLEVVAQVTSPGPKTSGAYRSCERVRRSELPGELTHGGSWAPRFRWVYLGMDQGSEAVDMCMDSVGLAVELVD